MSIDERLRRHFESLPRPAVGERLEARVLSAHRARSRRLRGGLAGVAVAVIGVTAMLLALPDGGVPPRPDAGVTVAAPKEPPSPPQGQVQAIDRALQAAYDHGASEHEIDSLWQARRQLLAAAASPERI